MFAEIGPLSCFISHHVSNCIAYLLLRRKLLEVFFIDFDKFEKYCRVVRENIKYLYFYIFICVFRD